MRLKLRGSQAWEVPISFSFTQTTIYFCHGIVITSCNILKPCCILKPFQVDNFTGKWYCSVDHSPLFSDTLSPETLPRQAVILTASLRRGHFIVISHWWQLICLYGRPASIIIGCFLAPPGIYSSLSRKIKMEMFLTYNTITVLISPEVSWLSISFSPLRQWVAQDTRFPEGAPKLWC